MRSRLLLLAVAGALVFAAGCENPASPDAATINGTGISRDALYDKAAAYASVPEDPFGLGTGTEGAYSSASLANLLSDELIGVIVDDAAERYGIEADPGLIDQFLASDLGSYRGLPEDELQEFARLQALGQQLVEYTDANEWWTDEEAERYAELVAEDEPLACTRHILVETEAEADDILDQLEDGADFAELAAASIDTASAATGGDLGCNPQGAFVAEFEAAVAEAGAGEVIGPIETEFGFHVILVDQPYAVPTIQTAGGDGWVRFVLGTADVDVDPRFGTWDAAGFAVVPPEGAQTPAPEDPTVVQ